MNHANTVKVINEHKPEAYKSSVNYIKTQHLLISPWLFITVETA